MRFVALVLTLAIASGQSTFRTDVKLVRLLVGVKNQAGELIGSIKREEFEAVKEMARLAREENEALKARIAALEARVSGGAGSA